MEKKPIAQSLPAYMLFDERLNLNLVSFIINVKAYYFGNGTSG